MDNKGSVHFLFFCWGTVIAYHCSLRIVIKMTAFCRSSDVPKRLAAENSVPQAWFFVLIVLEIRG
jgi:hypothetical protein